MTAGPIFARPLKAALFDFDGTLIDASEAICCAFNSVLTEHALQPFETARIRGLIGRPLREMFQLAHPQALDGELDAYILEYRRVFLPLCVQHSRPLAGVLEMLAALGRQLKLGIVTSRQADGARHILQGHGLQDHFATVIGLEHVRRAKPHPEPVLLALEQLGVEASAAVMVGDTPDDVRAGKEAGCYAFGVTTGAHSAEALWAAGADGVLGSLKELVGLVAGLSAEPTGLAAVGAE